MKRTLIINNPGHLTCKNEQLIWIPKEGETYQTPAEETGMVIIDDPTTTVSNHAILTLLENNGIVLHCNKKHLPEGITINLWKNSKIQKVLEIQTRAKEEQEAKIWKKIIQKKIESQHKVLAAAKKETYLEKIARQVEDGDRTNQEGRAARAYWINLFGEKFIRERGTETAPNCFLNYGYAILRSQVTQAICSAGLLPNLGIFHKHRSNPLPLADDLMEPLRTIVDTKAIKLMSIGEKYLNPKTKKEMAEITREELEFDGTMLPINKALQRYTASYIEALQGKPLKIPNATIPSHVDLNSF